MKLSLSDLQSLLYGYEDFSFERPLTQHPLEFPLYKVKIVPLEVGVTLSALDTTEKYFKIFLLFLSRPPRAEIWHRRAWDESMTKRCGYKPHFDGEALPVQARVRNFLFDFTNAIALFGISHAQARKMAEQFVYGPPITAMTLSVLPVDKSILERLFVIRELLAAELNQPNQDECQPTNSESESPV